MKKKIYEIMNYAWYGWSNLIAAVVTLYIICLMIFGGEFHLQINFGSWIELYNHFKK